MTQGGNDPLPPLHRLSTASLSGVVRCVAIATLIFRYFLRYFSSTSTEQIFPDSAGLFVVSIVFGFAIFARFWCETASGFPHNSGSSELKFRGYAIKCCC